MTQTRRYPLRGCRHLNFKYVENKNDEDLDFWVLVCDNKVECKKKGRDGGATKSCLTDPYEVTIDG